MALQFDRPEQALDTALRGLGRKPDAVLAVDDSGVELAALLAERLGLRGNPVERLIDLAQGIDVRVFPQRTPA